MRAVRELRGQRVCALHERRVAIRYRAFSEQKESLGSHVDKTSHIDYVRTVGLSSLHHIETHHTENSLPPPSPLHYPNYNQTIDGMQAEFCRLPHADHTAIAVPDSVAAGSRKEAALVMCRCVCFALLCD